MENQEATTDTWVAEFDKLVRETSLFMEHNWATKDENDIKQFIKSLLLSSQEKGREEGEYKWVAADVNEVSRKLGYDQGMLDASKIIRKSVIQDCLVIVEAEMNTYQNHTPIYSALEVLFIKLKSLGEKSE